MAATKTKVTAKASAKNTQAGKGKQKTAPRSDQVRKQIKVARSSVEKGYMDLAKLLSEIYHKEYHLEWGFANFEAYCDMELDFQYRKAKYLVEIWDKVKTLNIDQKRLEAIGWTKLRELVKVMDAENVEEWLERAESSSYRELHTTISTRIGSGETPEQITTFKLRMDAGEAAIIMEALDAAKSMLSSDKENETLALQMICQDWMEFHGHSPEKTPLAVHVGYLEKIYGIKITVIGEDAGIEEAATPVDETAPAPAEETEKTETVVLQAPGKDNAVASPATEEVVPENGDGIDALLNDEPPATIVDEKTATGNVPAGKAKEKVEDEPSLDDLFDL